VRWLLGVTLVVAVACGKRADDKPASPPPPAAAQRLISLTPSATEVVAALGSAPALVGVDEYSEYPPEVKALPKVGSFTTPNLEAIVRLKPTLVIVDDIHANAAGALHDAGITTVECKMHTLPDVKAALRTVGAKLGKAAEADSVVARIEAAIEAAYAKRPAKRPRVMMIIDREAGGLGNLIAAGSGTYVDELLAVVGGENVFAAAGVKYPKISMEEVVRAQPDVILDMSYAGRGAKGLDPWKAAEVPAVKTGRVVLLADAFLIAPSPRVDAALAALAKGIAPP
jgi:iron complex transport system substrate-binding protein